MGASVQPFLALLSLFWICPQFMKVLCQFADCGWILFTFFFGIIVSPCISHWYCSNVISFTSSAVRGHWYLPASALLYTRQKPSSSHTSPLNLSLFLPQNRNRQRGVNGSMWNSLWISDASPSIPSLRSVYPHLIQILSKHVASLSTAHHLDQSCQELITD